MSRPRSLPPETEEHFQQGILDLARALGWLAYHTHDARRSAAGFPDLVLCKPPRTIFAELKRETGKVTAEQQAWLNALEASGQEAYLWRPSMKSDIVALLTRRAARTQPASVSRNQETSP